KSWDAEAANANFFDAKRAALAWLAGFGITDVVSDPVGPSELPFLHPTASACLRHGKQTLGFVGELHPATSRAYDFALEAPPVVIELNLAAVFTAKQQTKNYDVAEHRFPPVTR